MLTPRRLYYNSWFSLISQLINYSLSPLIASLYLRPMGPFGEARHSELQKECVAELIIPAGTGTAGPWSTTTCCGQYTRLSMHGRRAPCDRVVLDNQL